MRFSFRTAAILCVLLLPLTFAGCSEASGSADPAETTEGQAAVPREETIVEFDVTPEGGGYISGIASQTLVRGEKTTVVEAVANPGFEFVKWSDGERSAEHRAKTYTENTTLYAIFEETDETTPAVYITTDNGRGVWSDTNPVGFTLSITDVPRRYQLNGVTGEIKTRGNASLGWEKKSYPLKFDVKQKLVGLGEGKNRNWCLISNHCDQSLIRNYIAFWLQNQLTGIPWSPQSRLVELYFNNEYVGNYILVEKVTTGGSKIDLQNADDTGEVDADFMVELDNYAYKGGEKGIAWFTARGYPYEIRGEDNVNADRCNYIDDWVTSAWDTVSGGSDKDVQALLDLDAVVDSYILAEVTKNIDCGWSSFFLYRKEGKLYLGPSWDFDLAMGNDERLDNGSYKKLYAGKNNGFGQQNQWYIALMQRQWFIDLVKERWNELKEAGIFDKMIEEIDRTWEMNKDSLNHNFERWPIFGQRLNQEPAQVRALSSAEEHVAYLRQWLIDRIAWLDETFADL